MIKKNYMILNYLWFISLPNMKSKEENIFNSKFNFKNNRKVEIFVNTSM